MLERVKIGKVTYIGIIVAILMTAGVFGPWLTLSYDPDSRINPDTKIGERIYHSRIELSPFIGSLSIDGITVEESWLISPGTALGGVLIIFAALMSIFRYRKIWVHFALFLTSILGFVSFFMSVGRGIAIGVITQIGWGMWLSGLGVMMLFVLSIMEMSKNSISRFVD